MPRCRYLNECRKKENNEEKLYFCICEKKRKIFYGCPYFRRDRGWIIGRLMREKDIIC